VKSRFSRRAKEKFLSVIKIIYKAY